MKTKNRANIGRLAIFAVVGTIALPVASSAARYRIDPAHTSVVFRVRHLFTSVAGRFTKFDGTIDFDPKHPEKTRVEGWIDAASIDTNNEKRDKHLRSEDFFHVSKYPKITFSSTGVRDIDRKRLTGKLEGQLTIRGATRPVVLDVSFLGEGTDPWGNRRAGFHAETTIDRTEFGLKWNEVLETGGFLVGDEVRIEIDAEGLPEK